MQRRKFSREFKLEAVNLVKDRGVSIVQASRDLDLNHNVLRRWVKELGADPKYSFPGLGQMKPEQQEIDRLRKEVARLKAERDILKNLRGPLARLCAVETGCGTVGDLEGSCRWLIGGQTPLKNVAPGLLRT